MKKDKTLHIDTKGKIQIDMIVLAILSVLCYIAPFATYTYSKIKYTISGFEFLTGKIIMKGKVTVEPSAILWAGIVTALFILIFAVLFPKMKAKWGGLGFLLLGAAHIIINVIFATQVEDILSKAKKVGVEYGSVLLLVIGLLLVIKGFAVLYRVKLVTALDFMVIPGLTYIIINNYLPMLGIYLAFKKINFSVGLWKSPWVGLDNFKYLFTTSDAFIITRNTLLYNIVFIIVGNILGIIVGICLSELFSKKLQKLFQTTILLPQLISMIIVAYIVFGFLSNESGWINNTFMKDTGINFYSEKAFWPFILVFVNTWKGIGYSSIIYLSSIVGIDRSLYEASYVDGCGRWRQIKSITLPLLKPTIITLVLLQVGRIFYSDFGLFYQVPMDSGSLYAVTQTIDTYVYRSLMKTNNISMAAAASAYQSIVGFVTILLVNMAVRKIDKENALF